MLYIYNIIYTGGWFQTWLLFSMIYGMSSFPLTFIFFKMVKTTNQPKITWHFNDRIQLHGMNSLWPSQMWTPIVTGYDHPVPSPFKVHHATFGYSWWTIAAMWDYNLWLQFQFSVAFHSHNDRDPISQWTWTWTSLAALACTTRSFDAQIPSENPMNHHHLVVNPTKKNMKSMKSSTHFCWYNVRPPRYLSWCK